MLAKISIWIIKKLKKVYLFKKVRFLEKEGMKIINFVMKEIFLRLLIFYN